MLKPRQRSATSTRGSDQRRAKRSASSAPAIVPSGPSARISRRRSAALPPRTARSPPRCARRALRDLRDAHPAGRRGPGGRNPQGSASGFASRRIVAARSNAETPVPVDADRSTGRCGAVPWWSPSPSSGGISRRSSLSRSHGTVSVTTDLSEQELHRLGSKAGSGDDHVGLTLASRVPDDRGSARRQLRDDLVHSESTGQMSCPRQRADDRSQRGAVESPWRRASFPTRSDSRLTR